MTVTACDNSNNSFSARDKLEKYAMVFTGSNKLNNFYGSYLKLRLSRGYKSKKFNASEIYPNLYVGDVYAAHNTKELKERGFTHIVNCVPAVDPAFPDDFKYLHIPLMDCPTACISELFNASSAFIHDALSNHGRVLVHCIQGMSRSATIASAYLMRALHVPAREAVEILQSKRGIVKPNYGFMMQLEFYGNQIAQDRKEEEQVKKQAALAQGKTEEVAEQQAQWRRASVAADAQEKEPSVKLGADRRGSI